MIVQAKLARLWHLRTCHPSAPRSQSQSCGKRPDNSRQHPHTTKSPLPAEGEMQDLCGFNSVHTVYVFSKSHLHVLLWGKKNLDHRVKQWWIWCYIITSNNIHEDTESNTPKCINTEEGIHTNLCNDYPGRGSNLRVKRREISLLVSVCTLSWRCISFTTCEIENACVYEHPFPTLPAPWGPDVCTPLLQHPSRTRASPYDANDSWQLFSPSCF